MNKLSVVMEYKWVIWIVEEWVNYLCFIFEKWVGYRYVWVIVEKRFKYRRGKCINIVKENG